MPLFGFQSTLSIFCYLPVFPAAVYFLENQHRWIDFGEEFTGDLERTNDRSTFLLVQILLLT